MFEKLENVNLIWIETSTHLDSIYFPLEKFPPLKFKTWHQVCIILKARKAKEAAKMEVTLKNLTLFAIFSLNFLLLCRAIPFHSEYLFSSVDILLQTRLSSGHSK